jgi:hypothetical protein
MRGEHKQTSVFCFHTFGDFYMHHAQALSAVIAGRWGNIAWVAAQQAAQLDENALVEQKHRCVLMSHPAE